MKCHLCSVLGLLGQAPQGSGGGDMAPALRGSDLLGLLSQCFHAGPRAQHFLDTVMADHRWSTSCVPNRQVLLLAPFTEDKSEAQRDKVTLLSPTEQVIGRVLFGSWSFQFQILCPKHSATPSLSSYGPSHPWQLPVLLRVPQRHSQPGLQLTLDREDEGPHGLPGCIVDSTAV